jgi:integrase
VNHLPNVRTFDLQPIRHPSADFFEQLTDSARERLGKTIPEETRKAYDREWKNWLRWCAIHQVSPLPASEAAFVNWVDGRITSRNGHVCIAQGIAAVRFVHDAAGYKDSPQSKRAWKLQVQYRKDRLDEGWRPTKSATVTVEEFRRMVATLPADKPAGIRDRAILALGLSGMFRRANIMRLDLGDVVPTEWGDFQLTVTRSKTDQTARGRTRTIPPGENPLSDPVGLLTAWLDVLDARGVEDGPLFRAISRAGNILDRRMNPEWVRQVVKQSAAKAGLKSLKHRPYRAHTLRSSGVTMARAAGMPWDLIKEQGDWSDRSTAVYGYEQPEKKDNAMRGVL